MVCERWIRSGPVRSDENTIQGESATIFPSQTGLFSVGIHTSRRFDLTRGTLSSLSDFRLSVEGVTLHLRFNPFPSSDTLFFDCLTFWHLSVRGPAWLTGFMGSLSVTVTEPGVLGLRVPRMYFRWLSWPWSWLGICCGIPLLDNWTVDRSCIPRWLWLRGGLCTEKIGRMTTALHWSSVPWWG